MRRSHRFLDPNIVFSFMLLATLLAMLELVIPFSILIIFDRIAPHKATHTLWTLYALIIASIIISARLKSVEETMAARVSHRFEQTITEKLISALYHADMARFRLLGTGEYLERVRTVPGLRRHFGGESAKVMVNSVICTGLLLIITLINPVIGTALLIVSVALFGVYYALRARKTGNMEQKSTLDGDSGSKLISIVSHPLQIKTAAMEYRMENIMHDTVHLREERHVNAERFAFGFSAAVDFAQQLSLAAVAALCALSVIHQHMGQAGMAAVILLTNRYFTPLRHIATWFSKRDMYHMRLRRIDEILALDTGDIPDEARVAPHSITVNADNSYVFRRGHAYAVSGRSGSGKSLLCACLAGYADVSGVHLTVKGENGVTPASDALKHAVILTDDSDEFIEGSIIENITCFRSALHKPAYSMCEAIGVKDIIDRLPDGFYTDLKKSDRLPFSRQVRVSLMIVRALLCDKPVLIIDDSDVIHDAAFEHNIVRCLNSCRSAMICIVISNRISRHNAFFKHVPVTRIFLDNTTARRFSAVNNIAEITPSPSAEPDSHKPEVARVR